MLLGIALAAVGIVWNASRRTSMAPAVQQWVAKEPKLLACIGTGMALIGMIVLIGSFRWERVDPPRVSWPEAVSRASSATAGSIVAVVFGMLIDRRPVPISTLAAYALGSLVLTTLLLRYLPPKRRISIEPL
jgi:ABC-type xylose transport system permease subunit